jgi:uncharacterized protein
MGYNNKKIHNRENVWAAALYVASLVFIFPFSNVFLPAVIWFLQKEESDFIDFHAKNVINFQMNLICLILAVTLGFVLIWIIFNSLFAELFPTLMLFSIIAFGFIMIADFYITILAAFKAYAGKTENIKYSYKFIKQE